MVVLIIVLVVVAVLVLYAIASYNGLIRGRNQVENAWSQIDVQLKRRIDLIPNLVETVKAYAAHEKSTLEAVINARNAAIAAPATPAGQAQADASMTGALRQLFALGEAYPDLKANQNFLPCRRSSAPPRAAWPTHASSTTTASSATTTSCRRSRRSSSLG